jgi:hypothetical protein
MTQADRIRSYARQSYALPARGQGQRRFSIKAGDVVRGMKLGWSRTPAVCSALKTRQFLKENGLQLISTAGPESGQTTTVTYTYEFANVEHLSEPKPSGGSGGSTPQSRQEAWERLRGALKDVYAEYGGGEAYLRAMRASFRDADEQK